MQKPIALRVYEGLGFIELKPGATIPPHDVAADEPIHFFVKEKGDEVRTISLRVIQNSPSDFQTALVESLDNNGRSSSTGGTTHMVSVSDHCSAEIAVVKSDNQGRYRVTTKVSSAPR